MLYVFKISQTTYKLQNCDEKCDCFVSMRKQFGCMLAIITTAIAFMPTHQIVGKWMEILLLCIWFLMMLAVE